jgi:hypothetical protein
MQLSEYDQVEGPHHNEEDKDNINSDGEYIGGDEDDILAR